MLVMESTLSGSGSNGSYEDGHGTGGKAGRISATRNGDAHAGPSSERARSRLWHDAARIGCNLTRPRQEATFTGKEVRREERTPQTRCGPPINQTGICSGVVFGYRWIPPVAARRIGLLTACLSNGPIQARSGCYFSTTLESVTLSPTEACPRRGKAG
ncbi:hypothetical protein SRHO_G00266900 [Serrasalmus rhombeus]